MLVVSYSPGYQNILKSLKPSTRQRFLALELGFPAPEQELAIVAAESGLPAERVRPLINLAVRLRQLKGVDLEESVSTRLLVYTASLIHRPRRGRALEAGMIEPLSDDADVKQGLRELVRASLGERRPWRSSSWSTRRRSAGSGTG